MPENEITLRKIEIFLCFIEEGSLGKAADKLGISKVSVHKALHGLEEALRCPLFKHEGRRLMPLSSAFVWAEHCKKIVASVHQAVKETRFSAGFAADELRLGALYSLTVDTIPQIISGLKMRRSSLNIQLTLNSNEHLLAKLERNELDAALIVLEDGISRNFETLPLFQDEIRLAVPQNDPLVRQKEKVGLNRLIQKKFIGLNNGFATRNSSTTLFARAGFVPQTVYEANDIFTLIGMVNAGIGYALLPQRISSVHANSICLLPLAPPFQLAQQVGLVLPKNREHDPNLLALAAECRMLARRRTKDG
ncbi:LysR family transcriptional regulator [Neisseria leonii]|uniref:LysR family transcriptional regulator n=1 Tax=Neisseria leonii TaxID=2995413 RepID=A0A9X4IEY7_9NEIS|nr:LysR family transcriptional regulator [Neisseria sp. 51.81]MDD9328707.1 LysR family transcriptional regulator [Neisseria sp. 51.81]